MVMIMKQINWSSAECDVLTAVINDDYRFPRCTPKTVGGGCIRNVDLRVAIESRELRNVEI